tara:strand:- start:207 stop:1892 length:1686 start_codon:yes stop_codon:yes gene_type:complete
MSWNNASNLPWWNKAAEFYNEQEKRNNPGRSNDWDLQDGWERGDEMAWEDVHNAVEQVVIDAEARGEGDRFSSLVNQGARHVNRKNWGVINSEEDFALFLEGRGTSLDNYNKGVESGNRAFWFTNETFAEGEEPTPFTTTPTGELTRDIQTLWDDAAQLIQQQDSVNHGDGWGLYPLNHAARWQHVHDALEQAGLIDQSAPADATNRGALTSEEDLQAFFDHRGAGNLADWRVQRDINAGVGQEYWNDISHMNTTVDVDGTDRVIRGLADHLTFQAEAGFDDAEHGVEIVTQFIEEMYGTTEGQWNPVTKSTYDETTTGAIAEGRDVDRWGLDIRRVGMYDDDGQMYTQEEYDAAHGAGAWYENLTRGEVDWDYYQENNHFIAAHQQLGGDATIDTLDEIRAANTLAHDAILEENEGDGEYGWTRYERRFTIDDDGTPKYDGADISYTPTPLAIPSSMYERAGLDEIVEPSREVGRPAIAGISWDGRTPSLTNPQEVNRPYNLPERLGDIGETQGRTAQTQQTNTSDTAQQTNVSSTAVFDAIRNTLTSGASFASPGGGGN